MCACIYKNFSRCQSGSTMARTNSISEPEVARQWLSSGSKLLNVAQSGSIVARHVARRGFLRTTWSSLNLSWVRQWLGSRQRATFRVHDGHVEPHGNSVDNVCFHRLCLYWKRQSRRLALIVPGAGVELQRGACLILRRIVDQNELEPWRKAVLDIDAHRESTGNVRDYLVAQNEWQT